jgi:hypothetical protein
MNKSSAGFKRGERAARNLALRLAGAAGNGGRAYNVLIALPGNPGTKYDFLDLFGDADPDRVRKIILEAAPFQSTPEEIEEFENRGRRKGELERVNQLYPLPALVNMRVEYRHLDNNEIWLHKLVADRLDKETGERQQIWQPISSPFGNLVLISTLGSQPAYGLRIHIETIEGPDRTVDILRAELPKLGASGIRSELMGAGLRVANGGEITVIDILKQAKPATGIGATAAAGWHPANDVFLILGGEQW